MGLGDEMPIVDRYETGLQYLRLDTLIDHLSEASLKIQYFMD